MFLAYEAVFRREVPSKVKIVIQQAGIYLIACVYGVRSV